MSDGNPKVKAELETELARRQAQNDKIMQLLLRMEQLFPADQERVRPLIAQTEAAKGVLRDCAEMLEKLK